MRKKSDVWKFFTRLPPTDDSGNQVCKARCNECNHELKTNGGTTNLLRHFLKHNIVPDDQGNEKVMQCNICQSRLEASGRINSLVEHVVACIEQQNAASVGESRLPPVQTRAPPGSGSSSMDIEPADMGAQPPLSMQTRAPRACSGSSSMDLEPAGLGAQLPTPPSASSCPVGSSSDGDPGMDEPSKHLAQMIAFRGYDPSIVDDVCFRSFVGSLKPEFKMPSRVKIEQECERIFDEAKGDLFSKLSSSHGRVSLVVGGTKTLDNEVMYVACHFIDDEWMLRKLVIEASMVLDEEHDFKSRMLGVHTIFSDLWLYKDDKIDLISDLMFNCDISNRLSVLNYEPKDQDFCAALKDDIVGRTRTREIFSTTYVDRVLHNIAQYFFPGYSSEEILFELAWDVHMLNLTREERQQLLSHLDLDDPWMYHDETWYVMYCSLKILRMENSNATDTNSIGELLSNVLARKQGIKGIKKYNSFTFDVWFKVWEKIHHAIRRISASSCPTSHLCLEMLLDILKFLHSELALVHANTGYEDIVYCDIYDLEKAIDTLEKAVKDSYLVWSIPLALDPRYKLRGIRSIFKAAFESKMASEYFSEVNKRMMELYAHYKEDEVGTNIDEGYSDSDEGHSDSDEGHSDSGVAVAAGGADGDDPMHQWHQRYREAEWERYLFDPAPLAKDFDILKWWKGNDQKYPTLARMARDILAMPTCSKPSSDEIAQIKSNVRCYYKTF